MSNKEPWESFPAIWKTKAAFFTYLRGSIRRIWARYPAKLEWKKTQLVNPPVGYKGRAKKLGKCHYCSEMFPASNLEVDHLNQAGACNSWETALEFLHKLLDCNGNWVLACKPCHKVKSFAERKGIDFKLALIEKKAIAFCKQDKQKVIDFLAEHQYNGSSVSTAAKRRKLVEHVFREKECLGK